MQPQAVGHCCWVHTAMCERELVLLAATGKLGFILQQQRDKVLVDRCETLYTLNSQSVLDGGCRNLKTQANKTIISMATGELEKCLFVLK